ncbi:transposase, partial [Prevotella aurantiaca]
MISTTKYTNNSFKTINLFQRLFVDGIQLITKLKSNMKGALMSVSDRLLLRKRAIIETVNDELKNISQVEHS